MDAHAHARICACVTYTQAHAERQAHEEACEEARERARWEEEQRFLSLYGQGPGARGQASEEELLQRALSASAATSIHQGTLHRRTTAAEEAQLQRALRESAAIGGGGSVAADEEAMLQLALRESAEWSAWAAAGGCGADENEEALLEQALRESAAMGSMSGTFCLPSEGAGGRDASLPDLVLD